MDEFTYGICRYIRREELIRPGEKVLAGVSGGADSTALLLILNELKEELGTEVEAVHVEHGIRGEESLSDEAFVRDLCRSLNIKLWCRHADVPRFRAETKESLEEAARNVRYEAFERIREKTGADKIALAHHADDQTETVLYHLCRGSGLSGLAGMSPARGRIIRPFLETPRKDIEEWLKSRGQTWRTDSTNLQTDQVRNRIRLEVLPLLEREINPASSRHIREAAGIVREALEHMERETDALEKELVTFGEVQGGVPGKARISCRELEKLDSAAAGSLVRRMIFRVTDGKGLKDLSSRHVESVLSLARKGGGKKTDLPGQLEALRERDDLVIRTMGDGDKMTVPEEDVFLPGADGTVLFGELRVKVSWLSGEETGQLLTAGIPEKKYTKWLACDTINDGICLRTRRPGDYLIINEAGGRKKLSDYMTDEKIPARLRDKIPVAAAGSHILWVVGYRISCGAKLKAGTGKAVCLSVEEM